MEPSNPQDASAPSKKPLTAILCKGRRQRKFNDTVYVTGRRAGDVSISFQRTVRVPDNQDKNFLPPSLGTFPLYSAASFSHTLPDTMAAKEREAMWIRFKSEEAFAIKIFLGGVNAVSGEPMKENPATTLRRQTKMADGKMIQDYVVTPKQLWLDGIASNQGSVRQFVAVPFGSGYSVEAQMTGEEVNGGMQFLVVPSTHKSLILDRPYRTGMLQFFLKDFKGATIKVDAEASDTLADLKDYLEDTEELSRHGLRFIYGGAQLYNDSTTLGEYGIKRVRTFQTSLNLYLTSIQESTIHLTGTMNGGGSLDEKVMELGIAPGGLIKQSIHEDKLPASNWDVDRAISFNVQILNSQLFRQVTGFPPPHTPVTAKTYADNGLPFFDMYEEASEVQGDFKGVKSVATIDLEKDDKKRKHDEVADEPPVSTSVVLLNADGTHHFTPVSTMKAELKSMNHVQF
ncbi:MAG: hypothetical protein Q9222_005807 [Ikaeria aurantiellina]